MRETSMMRRSLRVVVVLSMVLGSISACAPEPMPPVGPSTAASGPGKDAAQVASAAAPTLAVPAKISVAQLLDVHKSYAPGALDGDRFLFLSDAPGTAQIFLGSAKNPSAPPRQLTSFPDRVGSMRVAPGGKVAAFLKDLGGDENYQIHLLEVSQDPVTTRPVTEAPKVRHTLPVFNKVGTVMAYTSNARNGKDMDLYMEPVLPSRTSAGPKPLVELSGSHFVSDWRDDKILVVEVRSSFDQDVWLVEASTKKKKLLTKHSGLERYRAPQFSRDGGTVFVLTDAGREWMGLVAIDPATGTRTAVLAADHDIDSMVVLPPSPSAPPGDVILHSINMDGIETASVVSLDAAHKTTRAAATGLRGVIGDLDSSPAGDAFFVSMQRPELPVEVFRIDAVTASSARVTHSHHAGIDESDLVREELLSAPTFDGRKIAFFWYSKKPAPGEKLPVAIVVHGGPESQAQPTFNPIVQMLALSGYAVVAPNVRGSTGYGKAFVHLDDKELREDSVRDLHEVGKFIAQRPDVDPKRIALIGGSYGGYMVLAGLTLYPEQWAAGVDIVGIANFRTFLEQTAPYRRALREAEYGSLATDGALLDRLSPLGRVDRIRAPLMVIHGTRDPRVPIGEARQITEALKKRGQPVELMTFDDEGHGLAKRHNRLVAYPAMVAFLDKYVKAQGKTP